MMSISESRRGFFSRAEWALICVTFIWGATFLIVSIAMEYSGPLFFVGLRFLSAGLICLMLFGRRLRGLTLVEFTGGCAIGLTIFIGYALQTYGLKTIDSSTSAFLTALYVPLVPLLQWAVLRRPPRFMTWLGVGLAFVGLLFVAGPDAVEVGLGVGEIATLISTVAIAAEIILISHFAPKADGMRITLVQLVAAGLFSFVAMPVAGEAVPAFSWVWVAAGVGLGLASALIQVAMNWAQKTVSAARATIIYASEPVWAGVVGRVAGERLPALAILGGCFIVAGVIVSELQPRRRQNEAP